MKIKNLLIAAAITGALAAGPLAGCANAAPASSKSASLERMGCNGKEGCQGKSKKGKSKGKSKGKDKSACHGKNGCGGKAGKGKKRS